MQFSVVITIERSGELVNSSEKYQHVNCFFAASTVPTSGEVLVAAVAVARF